MNTEPLTESYFYILLSLYQKNNHGYGIMTETDVLTHRRLHIGSGTMYGAISNMMKKGWIIETESCDPADARKRLYAITSQGRAVLSEEISRLEELVDNAHTLIQKGIKS